MSSLIHEYKISCYEKIKPLDENDTIWLVRDSVSGRQCVMRRQLLVQKEVYQRLLTLRHAHIVEILDIIPHEGALYVIEEYLTGKLLSTLLSEEKMSRSFILKVGGQLLKALDALHEIQVIHRDVKPENVVVDAAGNCKLMDFDIARIYVPEKERDTSMKGTRDYAPPEQFGFGQTDERTDIYAFGVTLNVMATGCFPAQKICGGQMGGIVRRCVEFDPGRRFQNVRQIQRRLRLLRWEAPICLTGALFALCVILGLRIGRQHQISTFWEKANAGRNDRIVRLGGQMDDRDLPALLLVEQEEKAEFAVEEMALETVTVSAEKTDDRMQLNITGKNREEAVFIFEDMVKESDTWGNNYDVDMRETSPEYEILLHDMDQSGTADLVISLSRRKQIAEPGNGDEFYLTAYTILWVVYVDGESTFACSEPLVFSGMPTLTADGILQSDRTWEWIGLKNGIWELY